MTTKLIGMKDFRQNLAHYTREAREKNMRFIVLKKNVPVLEVNPIDEKSFALEKLATELDEAKKEMQKGHSYSQEEILEEFGLL